MCQRGKVLRAWRSQSTLSPTAFGIGLEPVAQNASLEWKVSRSGKTEPCRRHLRLNRWRTRNGSSDQWRTVARIWMQLNRRFMPVGPFTRADQFITATLAGNRFRSATPSVWQRLVSGPRSAASVMPAIGPVIATRSRPLARALAETINGLYKTAVIRRPKSWHRMAEVEIETLKWVDGFNHRRRPEPFSNIPSAKAEEAFRAHLNTLDRSRNTGYLVSGKPVAVQFGVLKRLVRDEGIGIVLAVRGGDRHLPEGADRRADAGPENCPLNEFQRRMPAPRAPKKSVRPHSSQRLYAQNPPGRLLRAKGRGRARPGLPPPDPASRVQKPRWSANRHSPRP